jgi:Tfp pilus assembly protein PilV
MIGSHRRQAHAGTTTLEVIVAFTLLVSVLGISAGLIVRQARLLTSQRDYRLALDELSNQLERLTALPEQQLTDDALDSLEVSQFTRERLYQAELSGESVAAEPGVRITLSLRWRQAQPDAPPVKLSAWVYPAAESAPGGEMP